METEVSHNQHRMDSVPADIFIDEKGVGNKRMRKIVYYLTIYMVGETDDVDKSKVIFLC